MGTSNDFQSGVIPYAVQDIFRKKHDLVANGGGAQVCIELSYVEIYMEDCFDLLYVNPATTCSEKKKLDLRETIQGETYLDGLTSLPIHSLSDVVQYLNQASKIRSTGKTAMNSHSSRSHALCTLTLRVVKENSSFVSKLNLVDLAGSERAKKTQATGDAFHEGVSINKGLLALGNVVAALSAKAKREDENNNGNTATTASNNHIHVPYRESKLTRLLKDSLGGNGMTVLLACVSPSTTNFDETLNTLRFASRASSIVNAAKVNIENQADASSLLREVNRLRDQLTSLQAKYETLQQERDDAVNHAAAHATSTGRTSIGSQNDSMISEHSATSRVSANSATSAISSTSTTSTVTVDNNDMMVSYLVTSHKLTLSLKNLLMQIFEMDLMVDDQEIINIQRELEDIRSCLGMDSAANSSAKASASSSAALIDGFSLFLDKDSLGDENAGNELQAFLNDLQMMQMMPPIVSTIDELKYLESHLLQLMQHKRRQSNGSSSSSGSVATASTTGINSKKRKISFESTTSGTSDHADLSGLSKETNDTEAAYDPMMTEVNSLDLSDIAMHDEESRRSSSGSYLSLEDEEDHRHGIEDADAPALKKIASSESGPFSSKPMAIPVTTSNSAKAPAVSATSSIPPSSAVDRENEKAREEMLTTKANLAMKEAKIHTMVTLSKKYESTIQELNDEIAQLEREKTQLTAQDNQITTSSKQTSSSSTIGSSSVNDNDSIRIKNLLKQKSKLLEEKVKLLRSKELELNKITQTKTKLVKDVEIMQQKILTFKQNKVEMMKKMKAKESSHRLETKELLSKEIQSKREVQRTNYNLHKVEKEMTNKEKIWKQKLEAKERESQWLKDLLQRQREVQQMKQQQQQAIRGMKNTTGNNTATTTNTGSNGSSSTMTMKQLTSALQDEMFKEKQLALLKAKLSIAIDERRCAQQQKIVKKSKLKHQRMGSMLYKQLMEEISQLDQEIKAKNKVVLDLQVLVSSSTSNTSSAGGIATALTTAASTTANTTTGVVPLLAQCGDSVSDLKAMVNILWSMHNQELQDHMKVGLQLKDLQSKYVKDKEAEEAVEYDSEAEDQDDFDNLNEEEDSEGDFDALEDSEDEEFNPDETFCPSDDDEDESGKNKRGKKNKAFKDVDSSGSDDSFDNNKAAAPKKGIKRGSVVVKKSSTKVGEKKAKIAVDQDTSQSSHDQDDHDDSIDDAASSEDDNDEGTARRAAPKKQKSAAAAPRRVVNKKNRAFDEIEVTAEMIVASQWMKLTVKDLKTELANRNLTVSGK